MNVTKDELLVTKIMKQFPMDMCVHFLGGFILGRPYLCVHQFTGDDMD